MSMSESKFEFDIAISLAKEDLVIVEKYADALKNRDVEGRRIKVYFYLWSLEREWGNDRKKQIETYRRHSRCCVVFLSKAYFDNDWTNKELEAILERHHQEGPGCFLPVKLDETRFPGVSTELIYTTLETTESGISKFVDFTVKKLQSLPEPEPTVEGRDYDALISNLTNNAVDEITRIADLPGLKLARYPNLEAGFEAYRNGFSKSDAEVFKNVDSCKHFLQCLNDFRLSWILELRGIKGPQEAPVETAFYRTIRRFWNQRYAGRWGCGIAIILVLCALLFGSLGFAAGVILMRM
jgi:hypothetical protein